MPFRTALPLILIAGLTLPVPAISQGSAACRGQTQVDMNFCAKERWQAADDELNRLWRVVKPRADARGQGRTLLNEQRAWLKQRDAACEPELKSGGSADAMFYYACMEEMTLARNRVLRSLR